MLHVKKKNNNENNIIVRDENDKNILVIGDANDIGRFTIRPASTKRYNMGYVVFPSRKQQTRAYYSFFIFYMGLNSPKVLT